MTGWFRPVAVVLIVALSLSTLLLLLRSRNTISCAPLDLSGARTATVVQVFSSPETSWISDARLCDAGEFAVVLSPRGAHGAMLLRQGAPMRPVFAVTSGATSLFDPEGKKGLRGLTVQVTGAGTMVHDADGKGDMLLVTDDAISLGDVGHHRILFELGRQKSGPDSVSYLVHDVARNAWIDYTDGDADGVMDLRFTEIEGQPEKKEFRVGDRWLEFVTRNGQVGAILDGQFMPVAEARAKLESRITTRQKTGK